MDPVNAYLGISLGKSYYSSKRLAAYCAWSRIHTTRFAFLIGDDIYRFTLQGLKGLSSKTALERARRKGDDVERQLHRLMLKHQCTAQIVRWRDLEKLPRYGCIFEEAERLLTADPRFEAAVRAQIFTNLGSAISTAGFKDEPQSFDRRRGLSPFYLYMLHEIAGLAVMSEDLGYELEVYPGPDLEIMKSVYDGAWPSLRRCLPATTERRFYKLELGE